MSVDWSEPRTLAVLVVPSWKVTEIDEAPATTWAAVRIRPWPSITEPLPAAVDFGWAPPPGPNGPKGLAPPPPWSPPELTPRAVMSTTPAAELAYRARGLRPAEALDPVGAEIGSTTLVAFVEVLSAPTAASRPVTTPAPSSAATTATATSQARLTRPKGPRPPGPPGGGGGSKRWPFPRPAG